MFPLNCHVVLQGLALVFAYSSEQASISLDLVSKSSLGHTKCLGTGACSATSDEPARVEELVLTLETMALLLCACSRYQVNLKVSHLHAMKRNFRYLKGQPKLGLWYPKDSSFNLVAYTDSDYAGASLDRKSTTRGKAKKSVKLMMEKLFRMELELMLSTIKAKTINEEVQFHALVDGKKIIITETTIRRDLQLEDAEGVDCLPNSTIFEQLTLIGKPKRKDTQIPQPSDPTKSVADEAVHKELGDSLVRAATTASSLEAEQDSGWGGVGVLIAPRNMGGYKLLRLGLQTVSKLSNIHCSKCNTLQSGEDRLKLKKLMTLCTTLQSRVPALETTKTTQANEITSLKKRVKKLERRKMSRTQGLKRLYKVGSSRRVESSKEEGITLVSTHFDADTDMFGVQDLDGDEGGFFEIAARSSEKEMLRN
ncbi:hypothetical protein Tco_1082694 [Tanacetum coccineum]|uniref:Uncharacterized protein n=1 Tax=Tanacetum coccineum TaxID=301880 RepID=A0ABQ5I185_9ASTR